MITQCLGLFFFFFVFFCCFLFFQAEDGIRDLVRSRGLGDVYKRQGMYVSVMVRVGEKYRFIMSVSALTEELITPFAQEGTCLLYTSDAADERSSVDLGGRRIIKKKTHKTLEQNCTVDHNDNKT